MTTSTKPKPLPSPIKYHGGKFYLAPWIVSHMPPHKHYVEPYCGSAAVLLAKDPTGVSEVVNDLDSRLTDFFSVLASPKLFERFKRRVALLPFSEGLWKRCRDLLATGGGSKVQRAAAYYVLNRQSRSGMLHDFSTLTRNRTRGARNAEVNAWLGAIDGLAAIHERLQQVVIMSGPAIEVIQSQDAVGTLHYVDPPYPHWTRTATKVYQHEMTYKDHRRLLHVLLACKGKVIVSSYRNILYDGLLRKWRRVERQTVKHSAGGKTKAKAVECLYLNWKGPES